MALLEQLQGYMTIAASDLAGNGFALWCNSANCDGAQQDKTSAHIACSNANSQPHHGPSSALGMCKQVCTGR
jgi:hypothetical protein